MSTKSSILWLAGALLATLLVGGAILLLPIFTQTATAPEQPASAPAVASCKTDWHVCTKVSELMTTYDDRFRIDAACRSKADQEFGRKGWQAQWERGANFHFFEQHMDEIKDGVVTIVAQIKAKDQFGDLVRIEVDCFINPDEEDRALVNLVKR